MKRPIAISLSPNTEKKDILLAIKLFLSPWGYVWGSTAGILEQWFRQNFKVSHAISFSSGRGALFSILKVLQIGTGDEVLLQGFTCVAVPNAVLWTGAKPIYVDITTSLTMDPKDAERKITKNTKAIILQHTFGIPSEIEALEKIAKKNNIYLIEDVAHTIGGSYHAKKLGTFGIASIFSFGRDKAFSSVFGGMVITNNEDLGKKIRNMQRRCGNASFLWVMQQLLHPIAFSFILPFYDVFSFGKVVLVLLQKLHILSFPVLPEEKMGVCNPLFIKKMPNALAVLAYTQVKRMNQFNIHREQIVHFYLSELKDAQVILPYSSVSPLLRFPILIANRDEVLFSLRKKRIYAGTWYTSVIDPKDVNLHSMFYETGMCPKAEEATKHIMNLPTYPTMSFTDAKNVATLVKRYAQSTRS